MSSIHTFGGFFVIGGGKVLARPLGSLPAELLSFLLLSPGIPHRKEKICSIFYPDKRMEDASKCLNTLIWRLKKWITTNRLSDVRIDVFNDNLAADCEAGVLDANLLERAFECPDISESNVSDIESVTTNYRGPFLDGFDNDWIYFERERLESMYIEVQHRLGRYYVKRNKFEHGILALKSILAVDPTREYIHRELMEVLILSGQRLRAMKQFEHCKTILKDEIGVQPMRSTIEVLSAIRTGSSNLT